MTMAMRYLIKILSNFTYPGFLCRSPFFYVYSEFWLYEYKIQQANNSRSDLYAESLSGSSTDYILPYFGKNLGSDVKNHKDLCEHVLILNIEA